MFFVADLTACKLGFLMSAVACRTFTSRLVEDLYGTRYQSGYFSLINVGSGFSLSVFFFSFLLQGFIARHYLRSFPCPL
jgi:hypothetical protein